MPRWLLWSTFFGVSSLAYWPFTFSARQRLTTPAEIQACQANPYCAPNLQIANFQLILHSPDTYSYFEPIYRWVRLGSYQPDYRLPGYGLLYGLFWGLTGSRAGAVWGVFIFQFVLWSTAVGLWAAEMERKTISPRVLILILFVLAFSPFSFYTRVLIPDVCAAAFGLMGLYALHRSAFLWAGLCTTMAFFLRPVLGVWLLGGLYAVGIAPRQPRTAPIRRLFCFLLPWLIAEGLWLSRNLALYGDIRPLSGTKTVEDPGMYHDVTYAVRTFLRASGHHVNLLWNDPTHPYGLLLAKNDTCPPFIVWQKAFSYLQGVAACPPDTIFRIGQALHTLLHSPTYLLAHRSLKAEDPAPTLEDCNLEKNITSRLSNCTRNIKNGLGFYRIIRSIGQELWDMRYIPSAGRPTSLLRKGYFLLYYGFLGIGFLASLYAWFFRKGFVRVIALFGLLPILAYFALGVVERRYLDLQLVFFLLGIGELSAPRPRQDSNLQPRD